MSALFGFVDYKRNQSERFLSELCNFLASECEERGVHASGIAFQCDSKMRIYKKPVCVAGRSDFKIPSKVSIVMGHTRLTTQGTENKNYNNHPFRGISGKGDFALAHNGMIWNDKILRQQFGLPDTRIETDSYVITQLLERKGDITFANISEAVEQLQGSFTVSILDYEENLFIVKGCNPISIVDFEDVGLLVYASTEAILWRALANTTLFPGFLRNKLGNYKILDLEDGDVLKVTREGVLSTHTFNPNALTPSWNFLSLPRTEVCGEVYEQLLECAGKVGFGELDVLSLLDDGCTKENIFKIFTSESRCREKLLAC